MNYDLIILISLVIFLSTWTMWLRYFYFCRDPKFINSYPENAKIIRSPAEGTIVYLKVTDFMDATICKSEELDGERLFRLDKYLQPYSDYYQIGIFMTQYDNHHVVTSINSKIRSIHCIGDNNESSMLRYADILFSLFGISFINWLNRAERFIHYNQQYVIEYENGVIVVITMDKYVNKFDYNVDNQLDHPYVLGFIHRGSQTDLFIPRNKFILNKLSVGDKVTYNDELTR